MGAVQVLRIGSSGPAVDQLQKLLAAVGFPAISPVPGKFDQPTWNAVRVFQKAKGLDVDGIVGPKTWSLLTGIAAHDTPTPPMQEIPGLTPAMRTEYQQLWDTMDFSRHAAEVSVICAQIRKSQPRYEAVSGPTKVPFPVIAAIHSLEGSLNFRTHLHNGDSLNNRTIHVPKGRPVNGVPPFTWEESAVDALEYDNLAGQADWSIQPTLYRLEKFNGMGYRKHGIHSPYLFSGSNHYTRGKFIADGQWSATAVSYQIGAALILKGLRYGQ